MSAALHSDLRSGKLPLRQRHFSRPHSGGFTLIEMVAVAVIIGILSSMVLFALGNARTAGQIGATKALIARLNVVISRQWQSYDTRRVPASSGAGRLPVLRQLMRMEMPDNWKEVTDDSPFFTVDNNNIPALCQAYRSYVGQMATEPSDQFANAECLYMIVTVGLAGQGNDVGNFKGSEIGDLDRDGAPEFHDAWGMPIRFLRWPIGFVTDPVINNSPTEESHRLGRLSDIMPPIVQANDACWPDAATNHDPFDLNNDESFAFRVFPLIYSAGPDKIFDIYSGTGVAINTPFTDFNGDEATDMVEAPECETYNNVGKDGDGWAAGEHPRFIGRPRDLNNFLDGNVNDVLNHYDNIHNHRLSTQ